MKQCPIFCLTKDVEIDEFSEMINWAYDNKNSDTVLILNEHEIQFYQDIGVWEIISEETGNYLFGLYEDDWIFDFNVMKNIITSINESRIQLDKNLNKIIFILNYAIENKRSVVFYL